MKYIYTKTISTLALIVVSAVILSLLLWMLAFPIAAKAQTVTTATLVSSQLDVGARGAQVTALQNFLATDPKVYPEGLVTGYYGPATQAAVKNFQIGYGLSPVGRVGPATLNVINTIMKSGRGIDVSAPMINNKTVTTGSGTATLSWQTDENASAKVFYSTSPMVAFESMTAKTEPTFVGGSVVIDNSLSTVKSMRLDNLLKNQIYFYVLESIDVSGNVSVTVENTFITKN
ncbi:MAG: peptidoglycan-binding domain-containing protein [Patescibacteria group bacterium]